MKTNNLKVGQPELEKPILKSYSQDELLTGFGNFLLNKLEIKNKVKYQDLIDFKALLLDGLKDIKPER